MTCKCNTKNSRATYLYMYIHLNIFSYSSHEYILKSIKETSENE